LDIRQPLQYPFGHDQKSFLISVSTATPSSAACT
jgi:hypothetical protein